MDRHSVFAWTRALTSQTLRGSQAKTLAWIVASLIHIRHLNLSELALNAASKTTFKHRVKRISRFLGNDRIDPVAAYSPVLLQIFKRQKNKPLVLAFDWTKFRKLHTLALVAVFGGRGVPVLWKSVPERGLYKSQTRLEKELLSQLQQLLPPGTKVIILADRGFGKTDLAKHCQRLGLDYVIRIKPNVRVRCDRYEGLLRDYAVQPGQCHVLHEVRFRKHDPVIQQVLVKGTKSETYHLMTNLTASALRLTRLYEKRMSIEETFRDQKSHRHGFSLRSTRVHCPKRFDRLLLVLAIGYCLLCGFGLKMKQKYGPSYWSTNKRDNELSVLSIARRMLGMTQLSPAQAFKTLLTALQKASPNWG